MGAFFRIALLLRLDAGNLNIGRWNSGSMPVLSVSPITGETDRTGVLFLDG